MSCLLGQLGQVTWAADASSVTGMPITPYMWRMPRAARALAAMEKPLLPAPPAASTKSLSLPVVSNLQATQHKQSSTAPVDSSSASVMISHKKHKDITSHGIIQRAEQCLAILCFRTDRTS